MKRNEGLYVRESSKLERFLIEYERNGRLPGNARIKRDARNVIEGLIRCFWQK